MERVLKNPIDSFERVVSLVRARSSLESYAPVRDNVSRWVVRYRTSSDEFTT